MTWMRASVGDFWQHMGSSLNAVLIWVCAAMALRYAMARDFRTHRRWALRLFLVTSAAWFFRITFFLWLFLSSSSFGFDPSTLQTPFITFMSFGQYLLPLAVLEIYFRAQDRGALPRLATAAAMFVISLGMVAGLLAVGSGFWVRQVKAAYDSRKSVAETLSATIASSGMASAEQQYRELKTGASAAYNFDEAELNSLGYQLLRAKKFDDAIRIFQLNVEAYPQSSNVYDSLGEGYMNAGNQAQAIANYEKSVQMNPKNQNGVTMLKKLRAR
jgi:tetratricopeptide (TPR) repeat protein